MKARHGGMHSERDDGRKVIFSWNIVNWAHRRAWEKMPFKWQHHMWKAINFGRTYGMSGIRLYESFSHRVAESPRGY